MRRQSIRIRQRKENAANYLMRYEEALADIARDDARTAQLISECAKLRAGLEAATLSDGKSLLYEELTGLIIHVTKYMLTAHEELQREVARTRGGEVLELVHERAERMEREAREEGVEEDLLESAAAEARERQSSGDADPA